MVSSLSPLSDLSHDETVDFPLHVKGWAGPKYGLGEKKKVNVGVMEQDLEI